MVLQVAYARWTDIAAPIFIISTLLIAVYWLLWYAKGRDNAKNNKHIRWAMVVQSSLLTIIVVGSVLVAKYALVVHSTACRSQLSLPGILNVLVWFEQFVAPLVFVLALTFWAEGLGWKRAKPSAVAMINTSKTLWITLLFLAFLGALLVPISLAGAGIPPALCG